MINLRIKEILKSKNITQVELARHLGVTSVTVNGWVTGRHLPSLEVLDKIAVFTNTPIKNFFKTVAVRSGSHHPSNKQPIINQLISKTLMNKTLLLLLAIVVNLGVFPVAAQEKYNFIIASGKLAEMDRLPNDGWTITVNPTDGYTGVSWAGNVAESNGLQYGKSKYPINSVTFTSSDNNVFAGKKIESVKLNVSGYCTVEVAIGDDKYIANLADGTTTEIVNNTATRQEYTFTGESVGIVEILMTKTSEDNKAIYLKSIEVVYSEVSATDPTKVEFSLDETTTYTEASQLVLTTDGRDASGKMLPIHYTLDGSVATADSPVYTAPILLSTTTTVSAYVEGLDAVSKTFTIEIPVVKPETPVASVNGLPIANEATLAYGTEITVYSKNATQLWDSEANELPNPYTFTLTDDYIEKFTGVNGDETSDETTFVYTVMPVELSVVIAGKVNVSNGSVYHVMPGTELAVTATGAVNLLVVDGNGDEVALVDGKTTINSADTYMIAASAGNKSAEMEFSVAMVKTKTVESTATFNFNQANAYGMTSSSSGFEGTVKSISSEKGDVRIAFEGRYRNYPEKDGNYQLRLAIKTEAGSAPGIMKFSSDNPIKSISFTGKDLGNMSADVDGYIPSGTSSVLTMTSEARNVTFTNGDKNPTQIYTVNVVTLVETPVKPSMPEVKYLDGNINVNVPEGHHVWYRFTIEGSRPAAVASLADEGWTVIEDAGEHSIPADYASLNDGERLRFHFLSHNPVTDLQSSPGWLEVRANGNLSGIYDVEAEGNAPVEYFNLQGIRVASPLAPGIYIKRAGESISKIRVD